MKEKTEAEKNTKKKRRSMCFRRRSIQASLARKKRVTPDQNILVTATLVKRERTFLKYKL